MGKKFTIILLALVLFVIVGGAFYLFNSQKNTAWKTYTNAKYNFSVDYPQDWTIREYPDTKSGASFIPPNVAQDSQTSEAISVSGGRTMLDYVDQTLEKYAKIAGRETQNYNELASFKKVTTVGGATAYETTWMVQPITINGQPPAQKNSESLPITYFEIPGDKSALIRAILENKEYLSTYEKMITTVKVE